MKKYTKAHIEFVTMNSADVITASGEPQRISEVSVGDGLSLDWTMGV